MTFTIVARDAKSDTLGLASQSHYFALGTALPWLRPGVGAIATQSFIEPRYGYVGLPYLEDGASADEALATLVCEDDASELRQVGILPATGPGQVHTGSSCVGAAGQHIGEDHIVLGNMLAAGAVIERISEGYRASAGRPLHERLLAALTAGQDAGGDVRGMQSGVLKVVKLTPSNQPWMDTVVDLRVDDHQDPIGELGRLIELWRGYQLIGEALFLSGALRDTTEAKALAQNAESLLEQAAQHLGDNPEALLWRGVLRARAGRILDASADLADVVRSNPQLKQFITAASASGLLPEAALQPIDATAEGSRA